jgi:arylsulfatase A-like enzyme
MISMPEVLKLNGYFTALSGKWHIGDYAKRGFEVISQTYQEIGNSGSDSWVKVLQERPRNKPFFMWFASLDAHRDWGENQYSGTHNPDSIVPPFYLHNGTETRNDLSKFYDEVHRFDVRIGEVLTELDKQGELENTLIIIMSDNGRPFPHSKTRVNDRGMKTPFIVYWPNGVKNEPQISNSLISAIDIAPTILDIAGIRIPESFQGMSFLPIIKEPSKEFRNYVFAEHNWHDYEAHERMVRSKHFMYILNSRPNLSQLGPADAVSSPSFHELLKIKETGSLSAVQADIFMIPRPKEELYDCTKDSLQLLNVASVPRYLDELNNLSNILHKWMEETDDNIPDSLTKDWYLRVPGYIGTESKELRGEMPGASRNAVKNNIKGPF